MRTVIITLNLSFYPICITFQHCHTISYIICELSVPVSRS
jgi:hypothetical protein